MSTTKTIRRILLIAAIIAMLAVTAYAADFLHVKSLFSGTRASYASFPEMEQAMDEAGFRMDARESFRSGYAFDEVYVKEVRGEDEGDREVLTYSAISVFYRNGNGKRLILTAEPDLAEVPATEHPVAQSKVIGEVTAEYFVDHYKFVPEDYEPTEADQIWMDQPGNFLTYGSDEVEEKTITFLDWTNDGIRYSIMDPRGAEQPEVLFSMAEELILDK